MRLIYLPVIPKTCEGSHRQQAGHQCRRAINVPNGASVTFVEDAPTAWHFVIPADREEGELSDGELDRVAGGVVSKHVGNVKYNE